ncbi:MAG: choline-sulfatase [Anaerolineales bacterium]
MPNQRPNILLIQADQVAAAALPMYGHPVVKTPYLSALAEQGVVFENAYCNSPLCSPSRFAMMTGQLPSRIGAYDNAAEFAASIPTFAHYLRHLGYHTVLSGKMHFVGPDQLHGFEERLTTDIYPSDFAWTPDWEHPERILEWYHTMESVVTAGVCETSVDLDFDEEVIFHATRKLYDLARHGAERPFCILVSLGHPHDPYIMPRNYWDRYRDDEIDSPAVPSLAWEQHDPHSRRLLEAFVHDEYTITERHICDARHGYYAALSYVDDKVAQLMQTLRATGFAENTIVLFTSDHGDMLGERGLWYKMHFYEHAARVPLIIHAPGRFAPRRIASPVSLVDLLPTFVDWATEGRGVEWADHVDGRNLTPLLHGKRESGTAVPLSSAQTSFAPAPEAVYGEYLAEIAAGPLVMIRRGAHKYLFGEPDVELLFDLDHDPHETKNLSGHLPKLRDSFRAEVRGRWDLAGLRERVIASQRQRHLVGEALMKGRTSPWDFQPQTDASQQYIRNTKELWELYKQARFPAVEPPTPRRRVQRHVTLPNP